LSTEALTVFRHTAKVNDKVYDVEFWDTAGQERYAPARQLLSIRSFLTRRLSIYLLCVQLPVDASVILPQSARLYFGV
jgi:GTPase SAR1 family protein